MLWTSAPDRLKTTVAIIGLWTLYAINETVHSYYQLHIWGRPMTWGRAAFGEFSFAYLCAAVTPAVLWVGQRFRFSRPHFVRNVFVHLVAAVLFMTLVRLTWDVVFVPPKPFYSGGVTLQKAIYAISASYETTFSAYVLILLAGYLREYQKRYRSEAVQAAHLRAEMVQAQLQALKMQLHPHFLFNTLHTISSLVRESPPAAEKTIVQLSDLLRLTLDTSRDGDIRLDHELHMVSLYLDIERTRYEERLTVEFNIDDETRRALVPSFVLQPLVENAIRHGIARSSGPGHVIITAEKQDRNLRLAVRNTGPGLSRIGFREGVGLGATRSRLAVLYGEDQKLELRELTSGEVEASIVLPFETDLSRRGEHADDPYSDRGRREARARAVAPALE